MVETLAHLGVDRPPRAVPRSTLINRNVTVEGHRTSIRLESLMWDALRQVCDRERMSLHEMVTAIGQHRSVSSLTSAIRVFLLLYFQAAATDDGHRRAGHGGRPLNFGGTRFPT
jgi:predicted DNA-binding ribbon-helix-helix protein